MNAATDNPPMCGKQINRLAYIGSLRNFHKHLSRLRFEVRGARCNEGLLAASRQTYRPFPAWAASSGYRLVQRLSCCATVRPSSVRPLDGFAGMALIERLRRMAGLSPALLTSLDIKTVRLRRMSASPGRSAARLWLSERPMWADHVHRAILAEGAGRCGEEEVLCHCMLCDYLYHIYSTYRHCLQWQISHI